jgi:hypothetical protein
VFDAPSLLAGAEILMALKSVLRLDEADAMVYFVRNSQYAWITGFVAERAGLRTMPPADQVSRFGGIEIGAKGVKAIVLEGDPAAPPDVLRPVFAGDRNTTLGKTDGENRFAADALADTVEAVRTFHEELTQQQGVPAKDLWVVASSGLPRARNWSDLADAIQGEIGVGLRQINVDEEVRLSIVGLAQPGVSTNSLLVDIGSGNTKGGVLEPGIPAGVVQFNGPGSKTLAEQLKTLPVAGDRMAAAAEFRDKELTPAFREQLRSHPQMSRKSTVLMLGGATWAMTTLVLPDQVTQETVRFTPEDIRRYRELLAGSPGVFPAVDLSGVPEDVRERAGEEISRVQKNIDPDALLAGLEILEALSQSLSFADKQVYFLRNSQYAWITGYVAEAAGWRVKSQPVPISDTAGPAPEAGAATPSAPPVLSLSLPLDRLAAKLDYDLPVVLSPGGYAELADRCYRRGWYVDSAVLWREAATADPQARYRYLETLAELHAGNVEAATASLREFRMALAQRQTDGLKHVRERYNGPMAVKLHELLRDTTRVGRN